MVVEMAQQLTANTALNFGSQNLYQAVQNCLGTHSANILWDTGPF